MNEEELFDLAIRTPPTEVSLLLDQECKDRPELRARIERLLAAHKESNLLDAPMPETEFNRAIEGFSPQAAQLGMTSTLQPASQVGQVIGPYTLETLLGEGGMGAVWVAKQSKPVKRRVALKLIKSGMDSRDVLSRFEHERQALAVMDHPNIARVLDAGITPDGRPYFAMELVNGLPLNRFCDEAKLTTEERLDIFVQICSAVQHAHQKGIIHRDLKPANILVTMIDGKAIPKVIDFGVSKALSGSFSEHTLTTQFGAVIGTIEYMAPEQAGYSGTDVDTRADIYALGVILYELLTGLKPFDSLRIRKAALDEMLRIIREEEPSKPSTRLSSSESRPSLAAARGLDPSRLAKKIRGDLDWIALKCLEKDRNRRYETANQLALEIKRYLADEPILAGPPSAGYQFKKFLRRNRRQVTVVAIVFVALLVGLAASLWQMNRAIIAERAAEKSRDDEKEQRKQADELRIKAEKNAERAKEGSRQAREALDTVTDDVVRSLFAKTTKLTDSERQFCNRLLAMYDQMAEFDGADRESLARRLAGYWRVTQIQVRLGAYDDARAAFERIAAAYDEMARRQPQDDWLPVDKAAVLRSASCLARMDGRVEDAERLLGLAEVAIEAAAKNHPHVTYLQEQRITLAHDRATLLPWGSQAREEAFGRLARESEELLESIPESTSVGTMALSCVREQLNQLYLMGRHAEALAQGEHQLELLNSTRPAFAKQGKDFLLSQKAITHGDCGRALAALGRLDESVAAFQRGLEFARQRNDAGLARIADWDIVWDQLRILHSGLGANYEQQRKLKEATASYREALAATERWFDFVNDPAPVIRAKAGNQDDLARTLLNGGGSQEEAIAAALACAEFRESHLSSFDVPRDCKVMIAHHRRLAATMLAKLGRTEEAIDQNRKAIDVQVEVLRESADDARYSLEARNQLGWMRLEQANWLMAKRETTLGVETFNQSIAAFEEQLASETDDPSSRKLKVVAIVGIGQVHHNLADHYWSRGERAQAIDHYTKAIDFKKKSAEANPESNDALDSLVWGWHNRGQIRCEFGEFLSGAKDFEEAIKLSMKAPVADKRFRFAIDRSIHRMDVAAENRRLSGKPIEALAVFRKVLEFRRLMADREPESPNFPQHITWSHHNICIAAIDAGKMNEALAAAEDLKRVLVEFGSKHIAERDHVLNVTDTVYKAADRLINAGQPRAARELYEARLAVRLDLAKHFPDSPEVLDAVMYGQYDVFFGLLVEGNLEAARGPAGKSIDTAVARIRKFPQRREGYTQLDQRVHSISRAYWEAKDYDAILQLVQRYRKEAVEGRPPELPLNADVLALGGRAALATKRFSDADEVLGQGLESITATAPNDWRKSYVRSFQGESAWRQDKFEQADKLLSEAYEGMTLRRASLPGGITPRLREIVVLLKRIAEQSNSSEDVQKWTRELEKLDGENSAGK